MLIPRRRTRVEVRHLVNQYTTGGGRTKHTVYRWNQTEFMREPSKLADKTSVELTCTTCGQKMILTVASVRRTYLIKLKWAGIAFLCILLSTLLFTALYLAKLDAQSWAATLLGIPAALVGFAGVVAFAVALMHTGTLESPKDHTLVVGCRKR